MFWHDVVLCVVHMIGSDEQECCCTELKTSITIHTPAAKFHAVLLTNRCCSLPRNMTTDGNESWFKIFQKLAELSFVRERKWDNKDTQVFWLIEAEGSVCYRCSCSFIYIWRNMIFCLYFQKNHKNCFQRNIIVLHVCGCWFTLVRKTVQKPGVSGSWASHMKH